RVGARLMLKVLEDGADRFASLKALLPIASQRLGPLPARDIRNLYDRTVNWNLRGPAERRMPRDFARCCLFFARVRLHVLRCAGWHRWRTHLACCLADLSKALLFGLVIGRRPIRESKLVKLMVGS